VAPPVPDPLPAASEPAPAAVPAPTPPPPPATLPAPRKKGGNKLLLILIALSVVVLAVVGVLALTKSRSGPAGNEINMAGPADNNTVPANETFNREAVLQGDDEFASVHSGPAAEAPIVARVNAGETFNTYPQSGIWWRVRIAGGLTGYLEQAHIRLREPMAVPPVAPAPGNEVAPAPAPGNQVAPAPAPGNEVAPAPNPQQPRPRPRPQDVRPRPDPRLNRENSSVMVDFCKGAGAGTPQCRQLGLSGRRPRR
jgi:hypothetical protein